MIKKWLVMDLDGTLANVQHRLGAAQAGDWTLYEELCDGDKVIPAAKDLLFRWEDSGGRTMILTGRSVRMTARTTKWLDDYSLTPDVLIMRPTNAYDSDGALKIRLLEEYFVNNEEDPKAAVSLVIDDTEAVVAAFRDAGYTAWLAG